MSDGWRASFRLDRISWLVALLVGLTAFAGCLGDGRDSAGDGDDDGDGTGDGGTGGDGTGGTGGDGDTAGGVAAQSTEFGSCEAHALRVRLPALLVEEEFPSGFAPVAADETGTTVWGAILGLHCEAVTWEGVELTDYYEFRMHLETLPPEAHQGDAVDTYYIHSWSVVSHAAMADRYEEWGVYWVDVGTMFTFESMAAIAARTGKFAFEDPWGMIGELQTAVDATGASCPDARIWRSFSQTGSAVAVVDIEFGAHCIAQGVGNFVVDPTSEPTELPFALLFSALVTGEGLHLYGEEMGFTQRPAS